MYQSVLKELRRLRQKSPEHCVLDIKFARALAFTHGGREMPWPEMLDHLIVKITPLAVTERLTK